MPASKVQLIGGVFQDAEGNPLALGYLELVLSQDGSITGVGNVCSGIAIKVTLNSSGSVDTSTPQSVWGNDQLSPANSFYKVTGFTAAGQPAWGPNNQQITGNGGTFDTGSWVPNQLVTWNPPVQSLLLQTNGTNNGSQAKYNAVAGSGITITDDGVGDITFAATAQSNLFQAKFTISAAQLNANTPITLITPAANQLVVPIRITSRYKAGSASFGNSAAVTFTTPATSDTINWTGGIASFNTTSPNDIYWFWVASSYAPSLGSSFIIGYPLKLNPSNFNGTGNGSFITVVDYAIVDLS